MKPVIDQSKANEFKAHATARKSMVANFQTSSQDTTNMDTFNQSVKRKSIVTNSRASDA
jgi:hypothetical protein